MKKTLHTRTAALWLALVFLLTMAGDGFGYHDCPHHGLARAGAAGVHGASSHHPQPAHQEHDAPCTCVGTCQAAGPGLVLPPAAVELGTVVPGDAPAPISRSEVLLASRIPYVLPYGHAPPAGC